MQSVAQKELNISVKAHEICRWVVIAVRVLLFIVIAVFAGHSCFNLIKYRVII